jgi:hypothetical protein
MGRGARTPAVLVAALLVSLACGPSRAAVTMRGSGGFDSWPGGTATLPLRIVYGQLLLDATLRSPSGATVSGQLVLDTGAPGLHVTDGAWRRLQLDTLVQAGSFYQQIRRSLEVELGSSSFPDLQTSGVIEDSLLPPGIIGLLGPSVLGDRALVIDYAAGRGALVAPRLALVARDSTGGAANLGRDTRVRRSRAMYAAVLGAGAVPVPFRLFEGGRMLVTARACEAGDVGCGSALTLLLDTGASSCVWFEDVVAERVPRARGWPVLRDVPVHTMLGTFRMNATVVPRLALTDAATPLVAERVDVGVTSRGSLPDLDGTLPERVHGLLGATFLARFRLIVDSGNQVAWLEPAARALRASAVGSAQVGLHLERRWGAVRVAAVEPGSPAAAAGVSIGDIVISIDGAPAMETDVEGAERRLAGRPGTTVVVVMRREGWQTIHRLERVARR